MDASQHLELFSESAADQEVIKSLHRHIDKLNKELRMIVKTTTGDYYRVNDTDKVPPEEVTTLLAAKQAELQALEAIAPNHGADNGQANTQPTTAAPADPNAAANGTASADANSAAAGQAAPADGVTPPADPAAANNGEATPPAPTLQ